MDKNIIMAPEDIRRTLARIAHEIIEQNKDIDRLILVGMRTRGVPLARRLAAKIEKFEKFQFPKYDFKKTNRKLKPYDVEVSYYGWDTLEQMAKDKQSSSNKEIKDTKRE